MKKAVLFDFDGVIIDSSEVQKYAFKESYYQITKKYVTDKMLEDFFLNSGDSLSNIFMKMGLPSEMISHYRKISIKNSDKIGLHKGMKELLGYLKEQGISCGLCTGKDRERTIMILENLGLSQLFDAIVCSDDVKYPKPNPESIDLLIEKLNVTKEDIVMVGDANNDIKCAQCVGVTSIGVTWGDVRREVLLKDSPDYVADTVSDLKNYIQIALNIKPRIKYLVNDFVVAEDICNMQCMYCLTQISQFRKEHDENALSTRKINDFAYKEGTTFQKTMDTIQYSLLQNIDIAILKISGGEVLLLPEIQNYILKQAKQYKGVQVLTNGVLLNEEILKKYKEMGNICLQISLDHHTLEGNYYRTQKQSVLSHILNNIDLAYTNGVPVEINCVLTDKNTGILSNYLDYLRRYEKGVIVYPFPVRGCERNKFYMKQEQIQEIRKIVDSYEKYESILAPKPYMKYLLDFLENGRRKTKCVLPYVAIGVFEDGTITPCPNYWFTSLGSLLKDKKVIDKIGKSRIYQVLTSEKNRFKECMTCFTPWDVINLYIEGVLSFEDLKKYPLYAFPGVEEYMKAIKKNIQSKIK